MKKRLLALVMVCTVMMTSPVFAMTKTEAFNLMSSTESAIQSLKQDLDVARVNVNNAKEDTDRAEKEFNEARKNAIEFVRTEGMSKKTAEGTKKNLKSIEEKAEEYWKYCKKLQRKAEKAEKKANAALEAAWRDYEVYQNAYNTVAE